MAESRKEAMTNREKAVDTLSRMRAAHIAIDHYEVDCRYGETAQEQDVATLESVLNAVELDGQIKALEWATDLADSRQSVHVGDIIARVAELRAEKAKLT